MVGSAGRRIEKGPSHVTVPGTYGRNEMDSHADTSCAGKNWKLLEVSYEVCEASPFLESYGPVQKIKWADVEQFGMGRKTFTCYLVDRRGLGSTQSSNGQ